MAADDRRIYDAYIAGRQGAALAAAVRIGLFEALDEHPRTLESLATLLDVRARPLRLLCRVLQAMGLIDEQKGEWLLAEDASEFLVRGKPEWLGGLIDLEVENPLGPAHVLEALRRDRATIYGGEDPWVMHARDPESARRFTEAMHSISARPARALARVFDLSRARRLLDVGGGSGVFAVALARAWPNLECVVWDLPTVCAIAARFVEAEGLGARVRLLPGDFRQDRFPEGPDLVLFSQILHDWPIGTGETLLGRAFEAMAPGGRILVHEKLISPDGRGPLANALVDLDMLVWTEGQQYDLPTLQRLLEGVGFEGIEARPTIGYWTAVSAIRPSRSG